MEALLTEEKTTDLAFILKKLFDTVEYNSELYPELMYFTSGLELIKKQNGMKNTLTVLDDLSQYLKTKLSEYYVVRNLNNKLQQDLDLVKAGIDIDREEEFYLIY